MSILIHMKMPKNCGVCFVGDRTICKDHCPLIELPPHGRLIDADALLKDHGLGTYCPECKRDMRSCQYEMIHTTMDFCYWVEDAETIIPPEGGADG